MYKKFIFSSTYFALAILLYLLPCPNLQGSNGYPLPINKCITPEYNIMEAPLYPLYNYINTAANINELKCIVIDPGHGGKDGGCHGHDINEKDISLIISKKFKKLLNDAYPNLKVVLTRDRDVFIPLHKRAKIANDLHADLFISIHCNSAPGNPSAKGTETFVLGLHRAEDNLNVAKRENESILLEDNYQRFYGGFDPNSPSTHILMSMFQNAYLDQSIAYADYIEQQSTTKYKRRTRGVKQAGFAVLRLTTMPSVLFETGFLSNKDDAAYLNSKEGQDRMAEQLLNAFRRYKSKMDNNLTNTESVLYQAIVESPKVHSTLPTDIDYYCIQLASTRTLIDTKPKKWRPLSDIYWSQIGNGYKYVTGKYKNKEQAKVQLKNLKSQGILDAFVVKYPENANSVF